MWFIFIPDDCKDDEFEEKRAFGTSRENEKIVVGRASEYIQRLQNFWAVACDATDGDDKAVSALKKSGGALPMIFKDVEGEEKKFMIPPSLSYAFGDDFTQDLVNVDQNVDLGAIMITQKDDEDDPRVYADGSKGLAKTFLFYVMNETIRTENETDYVQFSDLIVNGVPRKLAD